MNCRAFGYGGVALLLAAGAASVAAAPALAPAAPAPAENAGRDCIPTRSIRETRVIDDQTIEFRLVGNVVLRNRLPRQCPGLRINGSFSYAPSASMLCAVDTITVLQLAGGPARGATCGLGRFLPAPAAPAAGN